MQPIYFIASHESIYSIMREGIWSKNPLNKIFRPIDSSSILVLNDDGSETIATDAKVAKMVRMISNPKEFLETFSGNISSVFIIELHPKILKFPDVCKVKYLDDEHIEYLKNVYIDLQLVERIHVYSGKVRTQLKTALRDNLTFKPIVTSRILFPTRDSKPNDFIITHPEVRDDPSITTENTPSIRYVKGNILNSKMQTLVNTVNCVGVMGKGVALAFKNTYPEMFAHYKTQCEQKEFHLGEPRIYCASPYRKIVNFPTKNHWRQNSNIEEIEKGLIALVEKAEEWGIESLAIPPLGCGNGRLKWDNVRPLMHRYLSRLKIPVEIYAPHEEGSYSSLLKKRSNSERATSAKKARK